MALNRTGTILLASALVSSGFASAAPASAASPAPAASEPVTVIALTSGDGELTELAADGLAALDRSQPGGSRSAATTTTSATSEPQTDGVAVLTEPMATDEFFVAGVTWDGQDAMPQEAAVFIRVMEAGQWQEWAELEVESGADEPSAIGGTEPYIAAGAEAVQVQVTGDADRLPANIRLSLTPEWPSEAEVVIDQDAPAAPVAPSSDPVAPEPEAQLLYQQAAASTVAEPAAAEPATADLATDEAEADAFGVTSSATAPRPSITTRAGWGANESMMRWRPSYATLRAAVVHHTAGTNNYTQAQSASIVRGIYSYHAVTRGWGDIGYNFLVDKWGRIFEGRSGTLASASGRMPVGAHAAPHNTGTIGLSVLGDYSRIAGPQPAMNAFADILAWQFSRAGLDATHRSGLVKQGAGVRPNGYNLGRVFAHRDVSATTCPGNDIYGKMGWLANATNDRMKGVASARPPAPAVDPLRHTGRVFLNNGWGGNASIEYAFGGSGSQVYVGDWNGSGTDTLAIRRGNTFYVYGRNAAGTLPTIISYGRPGDEVLVGDWNGDGKDTFAVRRGHTFYVKNSVTSGTADHVIRYGRPGDKVLVGDWNHNGTDTLAVRRGSLIYVKNRIEGGKADDVISYGRPADEVLVGDWDGDRRDTFAVRRGFEYHLRNSISSGPADRVLKYGRANDVVLVGDWNGDRVDTLGVYRR